MDDSIHAAKRGDRYEALEPLRPVIRGHFGGYQAGVGAGLTVRHEHGSPYTSRAFQTDLQFLGLASSPSYVREPECNRVSERFIRTLKEQLLLLERFETVAELRDALESFRRRYNTATTRSGWSRSTATSPPLKSAPPSTSRSRREYPHLLVQQTLGHYTLHPAVEV